MRNHLAQRYFDTAHAVVAATITHDLPLLVAAVERRPGWWVARTVTLSAVPI